MPVKLQRPAPAVPSPSVSVFGPRYSELMAQMAKETDPKRIKAIGDEMLGIVEADRVQLIATHARLLGK